MGMRYYKKSLANLLFEKVKKLSEAQKFRDMLTKNGNIDNLAVAIAGDRKFKGFGGIQAIAGVSLPSTPPSNQDAAEEYVAEALRDRLSGADVTRVTSISDIHITPLGKEEPVVRVAVKFSKKSITRIRSGSTLLSAHDYIVFVDKNGYRLRWATGSQLVKFAKERKSVEGMRDYSADDIMDGTTEDLVLAGGDIVPVDMTKGEYEYITKLIRSRIAKARGDVDKADASYKMPFTIDGSKVRVDLKFESLFERFVSKWSNSHLSPPVF